jgi:hypothetical protein
LIIISWSIRKMVSALYNTNQKWYTMKMDNERYEKSSNELLEYDSPQEISSVVSGATTLIVVITMAILTILKAVGIVSIPWVWIFSPLWIPFAVAGIIIAGMFGLALISLVIGFLLFGVIEICSYVVETLKKLKR